MQESFSSQLESLWQKTGSYLCIGLDPDLKKIPQHLVSAKNPVFEFNKQIIDETLDLVCAYKPQLAYYSGQGIEDQLHMTIAYLKNVAPQVPIILDAKRGDIGTTAEMYAREAYTVYSCDAVTVNPYMGFETVEPFLAHKTKGVFVLCKTSNPGSGEFQNLQVDDGETVYERVARSAQQRFSTHRGLGLVVGATHIEDLKRVRRVAPDVPLLVPGVGEQGGSVVDVVRYGQAQGGHGLLINSSRGVIYASGEADFAKKARDVAMKLVQQMKKASEL